MSDDSDNASLVRFHQRIQEKRRDNTNSPLLIVAFGDSVTEGAMQLGVFDYHSVYHARLKRLLEAAYPGITFNMINAGICAQSAAVALERVDRDVIRYQPDIVIVGFGLNDSANGINGLDAFSQNLEQIVTRITGGTDSEIILLTTNHICSKPSHNVAPEHSHFINSFIERQTSGLMADYSQRIRDLAKKFHLPLADVYQRWDQLTQAGINTSILFANGLNHPISALHIIPAELVMQCIDPEFKISTIDQLTNIIQQPKG